MKLTNGEIFLAREPMKKVADLKLPVKTSYRLVGLINKLDKELKIIDQVRNGLFKKYGHQEGNQIKVKEGTPEHASFLEEMAELMSQEVEVDFDTKIKLPDNVEIEASVLLDLVQFIEV